MTTLFATHGATLLQAAQVSTACVYIPGVGSLANGLLAQVPLSSIQPFIGSVHFALHTRFASP